MLFMCSVDATNRGADTFLLCAWTVRWSDKQAKTTDLVQVISGRQTKVFQKYPPAGYVRSVSRMSGSEFFSPRLLLRGRVPELKSP
jgi:hypothetical protein